MTNSFEPMRPELHTDYENDNSQDSDSKKKIAVVGGIVALLVVVGIVVAVALINDDSSSPPKNNTDNTQNTVPSGTNSSQPGSLSQLETVLVELIPNGRQECTPARATGNAQRWKLAIASFDCDSDGTTDLMYGLFKDDVDLDANYQGQALTLSDDILASGGAIVASDGKSAPCSSHPNESGAWGTQSKSGVGGKYTCISTPHPRIVWTATNAVLIGDAELTTGSMSDLVSWWSLHGAPKQ